MGSLAFWGAVGGAAKGAEKHLLQRQQDESYEKRSKIDEEREKRLAAIQDKMKREQQELQHGYDMSQTVFKEGREDVRSAAKDAAALARTEAQAAGSLAVAIENQRGAMEREQAGIDHGKYDPSGSGKTDPVVKAINDKYQPKILTVSEASALNPENPLFNVDKDTPAIFDGTTWYLQKNDKYILPDAVPRLPEQRKEAEAWLMADPVRRGSTFRDTYRYLPVDFFKELRIHELDIAGYDQYGRRKASKTE